MVSTLARDQSSRPCSPSRSRTSRCKASNTPAFALADPAGPVYLPGAFQLALASLKGEPRIAEAFRTGAGVGWHEQDPEVFDGCGHGASTIIMAKAYPNSTFTGFDYHQRSIDWARKAASEAGVSDRVRFEVAAADAFAGDGYDLVAPSTASTTWATPPGRPPTSAAPSPTTAPGCWSSRPPATARRTNLNPVGRLYYGFSVLLCVPNALSQQPTAVLGNQAGEARTRELTAAGGFTRFRRAAETTFNLVYEVRP